MDNGSQFALTLVRMSNGGYVVQDSYLGERNFPTLQHFACTTIDEALKFMRDKLAPVGATIGNDPALLDAIVGRTKPDLIVEKTP